MPHKKSLKESRHKTIGIEAIVEPGGWGCVYEKCMDEKA